MELSGVALTTSAAALLLSLLMLVLILSQDSRSVGSRVYALFVLLMMLWISGVLISRLGSLTNAEPNPISFGLRLTEIGFAGACIVAYLLVFVLSSGQTQPARRLIYAAVLSVLVLQTILLISAEPSRYQVRADGALIYRLSDFGIILYGLISAATLALLWQRRRKLKNRWSFFGVSLFSIGVLGELFSPELRYRNLSSTLSALGTLAISYAMLQTQIIAPLIGRAQQLESVRAVGLSITQSLNLSQVLETIAERAALILQADSALIFLNHGDYLELAAQYNLSPKFIGARLAYGEGLVGCAAKTRQTQHVENYSRDWRGAPDVPYAKQGFGSAVAVPLLIDQDVQGVLLVVAGVDSKRFDRDDLHLLGLLSPQAAIAIANSRNYEAQRQLTDDLTKATHQLRDMDKVKTQMLQMTSHQLKNPLFSAISTLENLQDEVRDSPDSNLHESLRIIRAELQRMERIVSNILNLERVQNGKLALTELNIAPIIEAAVRDFSRQAEQRNIALEVHCEPLLPPLRGDRHFLTQALANLLENALKFTPDGGKVSVHAELIEDCVVIKVSDNGVGIPPEALSRVFERFFRAEQPNAAHARGSGLGLSLVKAVVDAHNGRVWLESAVGQGTTVYMALPISVTDRQRLPA
ncbi:MAG: GAF domain-containing sensor histidine kinase [Anaerolineae bacterium]|nr:GAF domain-containing sensor histidine kinase [Anaerolineae bacterium]MDW8299010.1 GAF domain-containing sensor histidine kinase [Anaerolineae bacterium]